MKFSTKLGLWFFFCILIIETTSMLFLHRHVVESLVNEELESLLARGNSHRDVLEVSFDKDTLHHISLMESKTNTEVVVLSEDGILIESSLPMDRVDQDLFQQDVPTTPRDGKVLQADWKQEPYIATVSPYRENDGDTGYVYMLKSTDQVQKVITNLNQHFAIAVVIILFFLLLTNFILIKLLTKPLISMRDATRKISRGDFSVTLPSKTKDELGELSGSIQSLANRLHHLKKERNEFLASISHELRTPLTYIKGYADIGKRPDLKDAKRIEYLQIIHEESTRITHLLEDLFELAKIDKNSFTIHKEVVDMKAFVQTIHEKARPVFHNAGMDLTFVCKQNYSVHIDPRRFEQIVLNLLDNALKYSEENTRTTLELSKDKAGCKMIIKDKGIGIPPEEIPYIFDRLYRVEKSRSRLTGGVGMGLSIVKELVDAHDGELSIESKVGKGTSITIVLKENEL